MTHPAKFATLIVNPASGKRRSLYATTSAIKILEQNGFAVEVIPTKSAGDAINLATTAAEQHKDFGSNHFIFACGGDGTVHEVINGLAQWRIQNMHREPPTLGLMPIGTANTLARDLKLPLDAAAAVRKQLDYKPQIIPVGEITYSENFHPRKRYFIVVAGAGPDGLLAHHQRSGQKRTLGRAAYYLSALQLFLSQKFHRFNVEYQVADSDHIHTIQAIGAITARISNLGGIFRGVTPNAKVHEAHHHLTITRPPAKLSLPLWFLSGWLGAHRLNPWVHNVRVSSFRFVPRDDRSPVHIQVDGDWLCNLPAEVQLIPDAISLLMPEI